MELVEQIAAYLESHHVLTLATVDEAGLIYELTLFYNWGEVGTRIFYVEVNKQAGWRTVSADAISEVAGFGRVDGVMVLHFTNHCVNCKK